MKYELLKERIAAEVCAALRSPAPFSPGMDVAIAALFDSQAEHREFEKSHEALIRTVHYRIMRWDVRCVGRLRELFPDLFPKPLRKGPLWADYDNDGDWSIWVQHNP